MTEPFDAEAYAALIGPKRRDYYLPRFQAMHAGTAAWSWHWPALFMTWTWLLYRKLWWPAVLYFLAPLVLAAPLGIVAALAFPGDAGKTATLVVVAGLVYLVGPALLANRLYYRHCTRQIARAASEVSRDRVLGRLEGHGGTSMVAAVASQLIFGAPVVVGALAAVALPAYQDYLTRAHVVQAMAEGDAVRRGVSEHYLRNGQMPTTLQAWWSPPAEPKRNGLRNVVLNVRDGSLDYEIESGSRHIVVRLVPHAEADGQLSWQCSAAPDLQKLLPRDCRRGEAR